MRPSIARVSELLDPRFAASRHTTAPISHTRPSPRYLVADRPGVESNALTTEPQSRQCLVWFPKSKLYHQMQRKNPFVTPLLYLLFGCTRRVIGVRCVVGLHAYLALPASRVRSKTTQGVGWKPGCRLSQRVAAGTVIALMFFRPFPEAWLLDKPAVACQ